MMRWLTGDSHERWIVWLYHGVEESLRWLRCLWRQPQEVPGYSDSIWLLVGCFLRFLHALALQTGCCGFGNPSKESVAPSCRGPFYFVVLPRPRRRLSWIQRSARRSARRRPPPWP